MLQALQMCSPILPTPAAWVEHLRLAVGCEYWLPQPFHFGRPPWPLSLGPEGPSNEILKEQLSLTSTVMLEGIRLTGWGRKDAPILQMELAGMLRLYF